MVDTDTDIRGLWKNRDIPAQSIVKTHKKCVIYDGPPYPTGPPHHGQMMASTTKDVIIRYLTSTGHYIPRMIGWDMHGPNVGTEAQSQSYIERWHEILNTLGRWTTTEYRTDNRHYQETVWWIFKTLYVKGHIQLKNGLSWYCSSCDRYFSDFERYHKLVDHNTRSVYYRVRLVKKDADADADIYLPIWEMRPWTLRATEAYGINPDARYVLDQDGVVRAKESCGEEQHCIDLMQYNAVDPLTGDFVPIITDPRILWAKETGVMQLAPSLDRKSYEIMGSWKRRCEAPSDPLSEVSRVITELKACGAYIRDRTILRKVSSCTTAGCNGRLILAPVHGPFYSVNDNRHSIRTCADSVYWEPKDSKQSMLRYVDTAPDWLLTQKHTGTPVPIWMNDAGEAIVVGSYSELHELGLKPLREGNEPETPLKWCGWYLDSWMDSACMPYASVHYPFDVTNVEFSNSLFPSLVAIEGMDQIHGWFFTSLTIASGLFGKPVFKNVITTGLVLDGHGNKLSKSRTTREGMPPTLDVEHIMGKYGVDNYRIYLLKNRLLEGVNFNFDESQIDERFTKAVINAFLPLQRYIEATPILLKIDMKPTKVTSVLDNWILQALDDYLDTYHAQMSRFKIPSTVSLLRNFATHIKKYVHHAGKDISYPVYARVFYYYLMTLAPFVPYTAERLYQKFRHLLSRRGEAVPESIHLCQIPKKQWRINAKFLEASDLMFNIIDIINKTRGKLTSCKVVIYLQDVSFLSSIQTYIKNTVKMDVEYRDGIEHFVDINAGVPASAKQKKYLTAEDIQEIKNNAFAIEKQGYYRNKSGKKLYAGQYELKIRPSVGSTVYSRGCLLHYGKEVLSNDIISKVQYIGRRLVSLQNTACRGQRSMMMLEYPPNPTTKLAQLLENLNKYVLPITHQSILPYRENKKSDIITSTTVRVYETPLTFHLVAVEKLMSWA